ncbi:MAG: cytochrome C [Haliscomenobacteraceae bacterium CHB4]|nr:cytochrome C [Haliscomenobacteraceae bacterium CHB4]
MAKVLAFLPLLLILAAFKPAPRPVADPTIPADIQALLDKYGCAACHNMERKLVGPKWTEIAAKKYSAKRIAQLVEKPEPANWPGYIPMAAQKVPKADMDKIAKWLANLK